MPKSIRTHRPITYGQNAANPGGQPSHQPHVRAWMKSAKWLGYRHWFWTRPEHQFCKDCGRDLLELPPICRIIDHVKPHRGDRTLFWDIANHQPMCKHCHDSKTAREDGAFGRPATQNVAKPQTE